MESRSESVQAGFEHERQAFLARLAGGLAHEIKNPLSTMAINLALLEEEWARAPRGETAAEPTPREKRSLKRLKTLQGEVGRLDGILDDFLHFARGGQINRSPQDLVKILRELLEFIEPENEAQGIRMHVEFPTKMPMLMLDVGAFKQALMNLFVNGRQAMPGGGELIVQVRRQANLAEITITDTGVGMSPEEVDRCFDLYWSTKKGGTGLGLSTVARIIDEHGGTIQVTSEKGRGTSFSVVLPLIVEVPGGERVGEEESDGDE
ncbi:MAG: two-component system sensor histidine kinase HydH [Chlamydiales bacterium]|jgi:two-component system sensor histidine kinase HydH